MKKYNAICDKDISMQPIKKEKIRLHILLPLIALFLLVFVAVMAFTYIKGQQAIIGDFKERRDSLIYFFDMEVQEEANAMLGILSILQEDVKLRTLWQEKDRAEILKHTQTTFERLNKDHKITHFYFISADKVCFLRVHNPTRFGDLIPRFTLKMAGQELRPFSGLEFGTFGTFTLRTVYPWIVNGKLVGYLELGMEIEHITRELRKVLNTEVFISVDKHLLNQKKWEEGVRMMQKIPNDFHQFPDMVVIDRTMDVIPENLSRNDQAGFSEISIRNEIYLQQGLPLRDISGKKLGHIVMLKKITEQKRGLVENLIFIGLLGLPVLGILSLIFFLYLGRIERKIEKNKEELLKMEKVKTANAMIVTYNHEINNPLSIAIGHLTIAMRNIEEGKIQKSLATVNNALERVTSIVKSISEIGHKSNIEYKDYAHSSSTIELGQNDNS